jgi:hypothetical protein
MKSGRLFAALIAAVIAFTPPSFAADDAIAQKADGEAVTEQKCDVDALKAKFESRGAGSYQADNKKGYIGKFQMGAEALEDMGYLKPGSSKNPDGSINYKATYNPANWTGKNGVNSAQDWMSNSGVQDLVEPLWQAKQAGYALGETRNAISSGAQIPGGCGQMSQGAYLMGAQLVGQGGVNEFLKSGGFCGKKGQTSPGGYTLGANTTDANGMCAQTYMCAGSSCSTVTKDMSKKTCVPTMQMINGISCSNFSGATAAFCRQTQPYLMTQGECDSAETMAENEPKGPNKEKCENLTFGSGTGSWSFALACSWAKEVVADQDGMDNNQQQPKGPVSDPACLQNLQGMGVQFANNGQQPNGQLYGKTCYVENAVTLSGTALPFGKSLMMACDTAIAMEKMGQALKGIGVTGYTGDISSTVNCRPKRDDRGDIAGTVSGHSYGWAVDWGGFIYNGQQISMAQVRNPAAPYYAIANQVKGIACANFKLVLTPSYANYTKFGHNHVEWGNQNGCK